MTWYSNGTITVTAGSAIVTGAGTAFVSNVHAGDALIVTGGGQGPQEVLAVNSDSQITLARPWGGASGGGMSFTILPTQSFVNDLFAQASQLLTSFGSVRDGIGQGLIPSDGSLASPALRWAGDQNTGLTRIGDDLMALVAGGRKSMEVGPICAFFASLAGSVALDIIAGGGNVAIQRIVDNVRGSVLAALTFDPINGFAVNNYQGNVRLAAADGAAFYVRLGASDKLVLISHTLAPAYDNDIALGSGGLRYTGVYAASGSVNSSDERIKTWRGGLTDAEAAAALEIADTIGLFQFNDAIAEKGTAHARFHCGVKAQQVWSIMAAHGLVDPIGSDGKPGANARYGWLCFDEWDAQAATPDEPAIPPRAEVRDADGHLISPGDPGVPARPGRPARAAGSLYSIRYDELAMFIASARAIEARRLNDRIAALEAKLAA